MVEKNDGNNVDQWWQGKGKPWKQEVIHMLGGVTSAQELLEQYPALGVEDWIDLKTRFSARGVLPEGSQIMTFLTSAIAQFTINGLTEREDDSAIKSSGVYTARPNKITRRNG